MINQYALGYGSLGGATSTVSHHFPRKKQYQSAWMMPGSQKRKQRMMLSTKWNVTSRSSQKMATGGMKMQSTMSSSFSESPSFRRLLAIPPLELLLLPDILNGSE
ncbi:hypothetical protein PENTCL1PPCAC_19872, partial [Pristionchus entomophagus]